MRRSPSPLDAVRLPADTHDTLDSLRDPRYWVRLGAVAAAYVGAAKAGIELPVAHGVVTPVWAPTGISLAALLIFGPRLWPAVALGAFVANGTSDVSLLVAAGIAVGNTLEAVVGAALLRGAGFRRRLDRLRDVQLLVVLGAMASTTISATNGITVLWLGDEVAGWSGSEWLLWWFGDAMGDLLVAPLGLVCASWPWRTLGRRRAFEGVALLALLGALSSIVFFGDQVRYATLLFPLLVWAPLRFRQLGAATSTFVLGAIAIMAAVEGSVPIGGDTPTESVQILQALLAVVAITLLVLAATLSERDAAEAALEKAQEVAHLGSWEWDVATGTVVWSDELYRIFGVEPQSVPITLESFLERVHPDDRARVRRRIEQAHAEREPFAFDHGIVRPDGKVRILHGSGEVTLDERGAVTRMVGTAQDITERKRLDNLRNDILSAVSHELRTPLTAILGFALTLAERGSELTGPVREEIVSQIAEHAKKLDRLLADLLDVDRLRRGFLASSRRPTDVGRLVERVVAAQPKDGRTIEAIVEPVVAEVDAPKVERVVENLLANALKYTSPGTLIRVRVEGGEEGVLIAVDDSGPGVPDEFKEGVFDAFDRGAHSDTATPGTGIGLTLVAHVAGLHGGRAWVEDVEGGGASFRVLLPLR